MASWAVDASSDEGSMCDDGCPAAPAALDEPSRVLPKPASRVDDSESNKSLFESCWQAISDGANGEVETPEKSSPKRKLEIAPGRRARRQLEQADCAPGRRARRKLEQESPEEGSPEILRLKLEIFFCPFI